MNNNLSVKSYKIWAYRAIDEHDLCLEYLRGHTKVLADFGIENVTSGKKNWMKNSNMYCVIPENILPKNNTKMS